MNDEVLNALFALALLGLVSLPLALAIRRSTELFVLRVDAGRVRFVRGRLPQSLLAEITDVLSRTQSQGHLRAVVHRGTAELHPRGEFSPETLQRLRNLIGNVPLQRIRTGQVGAPKRRD